jgi:tRNA modification GTPase
LDSEALVLHFPAPKTVTGEDMLELHIHGGSATVRAVLSGISRCSSASTVRYAEPGEFTRRAFQNDRLDLAQVEALSDTLSAETEQQRRAAVRGNSGILGKTYDNWRHQLLYARGELEALIDFSEDQHFDETPVELLKNVSTQVDNMLESIAVHDAASHRGELLRKGIRISLLGPPNAGKSSLLNRIVGREASIVSSEAGTTRDIVEVSLDIRGYLCTFADTAGLRSSSTVTAPLSSPSNQSLAIGDIEKEGIRRAKAKANESDLVIVLASVERCLNDAEWRINFDKESLTIATNAEASLIIVNKTDAVDDELFNDLLQNFKERVSAITTSPIIPISCKLAESNVKNAGNVEVFLDSLVKAFQTLTAPPTDDEHLLGVTERQRQLLDTCRQHLLDFTAEASISSESDEECDIVVAAEHLRFAANCLSRITGQGDGGDVEEVLGVVFEK